MTDRRLRDLWDKLRDKKPHMPHFLESASVINIRGIHNLEVKFEYPVSVLAGSNGSGKSTVLLAAACAYAPPGTSGEGVGKGFSPYKFFLDYQSKSGGQEGEKDPFTVQFNYSTPDGQRFLFWQCLKNSMGIPYHRYSGGNQLERSVYLITPGTLSNPFDTYNVHNMSYEVTELQETSLTSSQIEFAQGLLPFRYSRVIDWIHPNLKFGNEGGMLLAKQENGVVYSEPHMATGERAILRMSQDIADAKGALILIDEVEAGLHPSIQKSLMLKLQQLALRNDLQIIVTTHSPVVLDSVPEIGRIFLDRNKEGKILVHPPYRDLVQDALYGRSDKKFNLLCEDEVAKSILEGVVDTIMYSRLRAKRESLNIEYTEDGVSQFPMYAQVLKQFDQNIIFILDGDQRDRDVEQKIQDRIQKTQNNTQHPGRVMFLPGTGAPEEWVWARMRAHSDDFAAGLGLHQDDLAQQIKRRDADYASAAGSSDEIAKDKLRDLSEVVNRDVPGICRIVSRWETEQEESDIQPLVEELVGAFQAWRGEA